MKHIFFTIFLSITVASTAFAQIQLDFGANFSNGNFPATDSTLDYGVVGNDGLGTDIYARITALNSFTSSTSGTVNNDAYINLESNIAKLRLSLYKDATYSTLYAPTPAQSYSWTTTFADIEGTNGNGNIYESITLHSPGTFTVANDSVLVITADGDSTTFSGQGSSLYANPTTNVLTALQGQVAVAYTATNISTFDFDYRAIGSPRNMYIDVGNLVFSTDTSDFEVGEVAVPEPASLAFFALALSSFAASLLIRRKRK